MATAEPRVTVNLRIPGTWEHPRELLDRLPREFRLTKEALLLPDGGQVEFDLMDADEQFPEVFRTSCRRTPTVEEQLQIDEYKVNVVLSGPGGSLAAAQTMMAAASAIVRAGGAGVFIDNSALSHGGKNWLDLTEDGSPDAISFAIVSIIRGEFDVRTMGMHVLGHREIVMKRTDIEVEGFDIIEVILYVCRGEKPIDNGHLIADLDGPRFRVSLRESRDPQYQDSPLYNPYGEMQLVSLRDFAESN